MEGELSKRLMACRWLTLLSVSLYAMSCLIVAPFLDCDPLWWPLLFFSLGFDIAWFANLTLARGWYQLRAGRVAEANSLGVVSVGLAAMYWLDPGGVHERDVLRRAAGYCVWVASMVVLVAAPRLVAPDRERDESPK